MELRGFLSRKYEHHEEQLLHSTRPPPRPYPAVQTVIGRGGGGGKRLQNSKQLGSNFVKGPSYKRVQLMLLLDFSDNCVNQMTLFMHDVGLYNVEAETTQMKVHFYGTAQLSCRAKKNYKREEMT